MSELRVTTLQHEAAATSNITLAANGNVGIGTSSLSSYPYSKLVTYAATGDVWNSTDAVAVTGASGFHFYNNGVLRGEINTGGTSFAPWGGANSFNFLGLAAAPMTFATNSAERMRIDSAGRVTMPYQPAFGAGGGTVGNESKSAGSFYVFNTPFVNRGNYYNPSTGLFTAPIGGVYFFSATLYLNSTGQVVFTINGTPPGGAGDPDLMVYATAAGQTGSMQMVVPLAAGDNVGISSRTGQGACAMYMGHSSYSGHLLG
tara:strand:- start:56 stop:832 length:777 start_codon:yes stop_codon:yes gene_type:complete